MLIILVISWEGPFIFSTTGGLSRINKVPIPKSSDMKIINAICEESIFPSPFE
jgi:hypothetical protein